MQQSFLWLYNFFNHAVTLKNILKGLQYYALYSCLCWWTNNKKQQGYKIVEALEHMLRSRQHALFLYTVEKNMKIL